MLLIYSTKTSTRLQYICKFIFEEVLKTSFSITLHADSFEKHDGAKINYSDQDFRSSYKVKPCALLFENSIIPQNINCSWEGEKSIFVQTNGDHSFDIFAASFYLISRYEEYLPHEVDMYGRYAHDNSLAHKHGFLHLPLINIWLNDFKINLLEIFSDLKFQDSTFSFIPTYDIDIAWSYKQKGFLRNAAGFLKFPSIERISTLLGLASDPYDSYVFLDELHKEHNLAPIYFFLVAKQNSVYDKNILPDNTEMQKLIQDHAAIYKIGLHPSWKSFGNENMIREEKNTLEFISNKPINHSRQHYIKMTLPETYRQLIAAGITDDYSMGYGSINGFRASVASSYSWYDLANEKITNLRIHPFCFMDANCFYEQKLSVDESFEELMHYYSACKKVGATFITIFHNNFLGTDKKFAGWRELYLNFISRLSQPQG